VRPIRKLIHLLRRIIGIHNVVDVLGQIPRQTADLMALANDLSADPSAPRDGQPDSLKAHLEEEATVPHSCLTEQIAEAAPQIARTAWAKPAYVPPRLPPDLRTLEHLARGLQANGDLDLRDLCELEALGKKGLFVVGNVRSGTSILQRCLNLSKDVYLLDESDIFRNHSKSDFRWWFHQKHEGFRNAPIKGRFIPAPPIELPSGMAYLAWLARHYRYVGEKITFGPMCTLEGVPYPDVFFAFQSQFFFLAAYFIIVRNPIECIWSSHKMFYEVPIESVIECWLRSVNLAIDLYAAFPNCYMIFFEDLANQTIDRISQILQTEIRLPGKMLNDEAKCSRLPKGEIPEDLSDFRRPLEDCMEIYDHLTSLFSPHTLFYDGEGDMLEVLPGALKARIAQTLDSVIPGATCLKYKIAG
jgi:hypothetical protein